MCVYKTGKCVRVNFERTFLEKKLLILLAYPVFVEFVFKLVFGWVCKIIFLSFKFGLLLFMKKVYLYLKKLLLIRSLIRGLFRVLTARVGNSFDSRVILETN